MMKVRELVELLSQLADQDAEVEVAEFSEGSFSGDGGEAYFIEFDPRSHLVVRDGVVQLGHVE